METNSNSDKVALENNDDKMKARNSDLEYIKGFKNEPEKLNIEVIKNDNIIYHKSIKIILIGDSKVGKTSILHRLIDDKFDEKYIP